MAEQFFLSQVKVRWAKVFVLSCMDNNYYSYYVLHVDNIWPIHSSPLIYPKSKDDATFIELVYFSQGCY